MPRSFKLPPKDPLQSNRDKAEKESIEAKIKDRYSHPTGRRNENKGENPHQPAAKRKFTIQYQDSPERIKKATAFEKSARGKIGGAVGLASSPVADLLTKKGKGETLGHTRAAIRKLGWGSKTADKLKDYGKRK